MTKVVRALWLAERRVSMSMQTWLWRQNVLLFAPDYASTNLKKFWVENLTHLLYQFTHSFVGWNLENHRKHAVSIFFCLRWHFKWEKPILLESNFISKQELITHTSFVYKTLQLVRISLLNTTLNKELCFFLRKVILYRASDISRGRGPAKFRYFREIPRNSPKNAKYREIRQKYFQIHVGKTYLILILAIRPVLFTPNVQIYLETSSLQQVNNVPKLPGVLRLMLRKTRH